MGEYIRLVLVPGGELWCSGKRKCIGGERTPQRSGSSGGDDGGGDDGHGGGSCSDCDV